MSGAIGLQQASNDDAAAEANSDLDGLPRQAPLPPMKSLLLPDDERFAHPAEVEFARLMTFYGVRWAYEPTTFAVRWGEDGRPREFVTPDFYLPDHGLYVELTTMRQRLVTRKNRKFRLLRQGYPNIRVRLLYLRDFERMRDFYRRERDATEPRLGSPLFAEGEVETRIARMAEELLASSSEAWAAAPVARPLLLGVGAGSDRFLTSLVTHLERLGVPADAERVKVTSYHGPATTNRARLEQVPLSPIAGRHVVIVQDVLNTGLSAAFLECWLRRRGAAGVSVCALLDREAARVIDVPVACRGFTAPDVALAGYGLSRWREFRDLPFIAEIETG